MRQVVARAFWMVVAGVGLASCDLLVIKEPTQEPIAIGDPLPGSFHLTSRPQLVPYEVIIRADHDGSASTWSEWFPTGAPVWVNQAALGDDYGIRVNDELCTGRFSVEEGEETDLVVILADSTCRVEVVATHPEGMVQHRYVPRSAQPSLE